MTEIVPWRGKPSELPDVESWVVLDTETSTVHQDDEPYIGVSGVAVVSLAWLDDQGIRTTAFPFGMYDLDQGSLFDNAQSVNLPYDEWQALCKWLVYPKRRYIFHNAMFDLMMMRCGTTMGWEGVDLEPWFKWDTMVVQRELDPLHQVGLKDTAARLWGPHERDDEKAIKKLRAMIAKKYKIPLKRVGYHLLPWTELGKYAEKDADQTMRLFLNQLERLDNGDAEWPTVRHRLEVTRTLHLIQSRGIPWDKDLAEDACKVLRKERKRLEAELPFKPANVNAAKVWFFEKPPTGLGLIPHKMTPGGVKGRPQPTLDDEVLRRLVANGVKGAAEWDLYSEIDRALSMWYEGYSDKVGHDGRLRCVFRQTKVVSGRMSVERIQLHAIPKDHQAVRADVPSVRDLIVPRDGYVLWNLDLSQAELRVAAKYSGCNTMLDMLLQGADLHGITAEKVLHADRSDPTWKEKRDIAKRLTFGSIFQIGGPKFQSTLAENAGIYLPLGECQQIVSDWRRMYPEFSAAYNRYDRFAQQKGWVRLLPGTDYSVKSYFDMRQKWHTGWSRVVQGSLAEFLQIWLVETERQWPGVVVLTVHDSLVLELPEAGGKALARAIADYGEERATWLFGVKMKVDVGPFSDGNSTWQMNQRKIREAI